jgi:hypothetical protein
MRTNLIEMLDDVNLPVHLGLDGSGELFGGAQQLVHTTSWCTPRRRSATPSSATE